MPPKTLVSCAILLLSLPCQLDHLKKGHIGKTIVALRKHRLESVDNKRMLKALMEKWSRPIFQKSTDSRSASGVRHTSEHPEIAVMRQVQKMQSLTGAAGSKPGSAAPSPQKHTGEESQAGEEEDPEGSAPAQQNPLEAAIDESNKNTVVDHRQRVRTPYTTGFFFTVRPESKVHLPAASRQREEDVAIDTETGKVVRSKAPKAAPAESYQSVLTKQISELNKKRGVMGLGVKKAFKLQLK